MRCLVLLAVLSGALAGVAAIATGAPPLARTVRPTVMLGAAGDARYAPVRRFAAPERTP